MKKFKYIIVPIIVLSLVVALAVAFTGCKPKTDSRPDEMSVKEVTLTSVSTSALMLAQMQPSVGTVQTADGEQTEEVEENKDIERLEPYMDLVESYLSDNGLKISEEKLENQEYETKYVVTFKDVEGATVQIEIYLNMKLTKDKKQVDFDDLDNEETEEQQEFAIDGKMVIGEQEYVVTGKYEIETEVEEKETEVEKTLSLTASDEIGNMIRIKVEDEVEVEDGKTEIEKSFSYEIKEKDKPATKLKIKIEEEEGEESVKLYMNDGTGKSLNYKFKKQVKENKTMYKGHIYDSANEEVVKFNIHINEDGTYKYVIIDKEGKESSKGTMGRYGFKGNKVQKREFYQKHVARENEEV